MITSKLLEQYLPILSLDQTCIDQVMAKKRHSPLEPSSTSATMRKKMMLPEADAVVNYKVPRLFFSECNGGTRPS